LVQVQSNEDNFFQFLTVNNVLLKKSKSKKFTYANNTPQPLSSKNASLINNEHDRKPVFIIDMWRWGFHGRGRALIIGAIYSYQVGF
jgi:hypothetical protein